MFSKFTGEPYKPLRIICYEEIIRLPESLTFLAPERIQRDFPLPQTDFGVPVIEGGTKSTLNFEGRYTFLECGMEVLGNFDPLDALLGHQSSISVGKIYRDRSGQLCFDFEALAENPYIRQYQEDMGLKAVNAKAHDKYISTDHGVPTLLTGSYHVMTPAGTPMNNPSDGTRIVTPFDMMILQEFSAVVVIDGAEARFLFDGDLQLYTPEAKVGSGFFRGVGRVEI